MIYILAFLGGVALWTLAEYLLHRYLGHVHKGRNFFKAEHLTHHAVANYFAPAWKKAVMAVVVASTLTMLLSLLLPITHALVFIAGFTGMYGLYEYTHYRYHAAEPVVQPFIILRKHHFYHHFHNPMMNHGVTTRFWDRVFGTFVRVEKVKVPRKMTMSWLMADEEHVKPEYALHFQLGKR